MLLLYLLRSLSEKEGGAELFFVLTLLEGEEGGGKRITVFQGYFVRHPGGPSLTAGGPLSLGH